MQALRSAQKKLRVSFQHAPRAEVNRVLLQIGARVGAELLMSLKAIR